MNATNSRSVTGLFAPLTFSRLGRRLVTNIILISAGFTLVASGVQLYEIFRRDRAAIISEIETVETSFRIGLEGALWQFNFQQVDLLLAGILAQPDIVRVTLTAPTGQSWELGVADSDALTKQTFDLIHPGVNDKAVPVGQLEVGVSMDRLWRALRGQIITIALTNFLRTFAVAFLILFLFDRMASRHLRHIARQVESEAWLHQTPDLQLERKQRPDEDELDQIVAGINRSRQDAIKSYKEVLDQKKKLDALNAELQHTNREQAAFSYSISHDLKSPINTLDMLFNELAGEETRNNADLEREIVEDIAQTIERMRRLIEGTLQYSQTVGAESRFEPVNLDQTLNDVLADLDADIGAAQAEIQWDRFGWVQGHPIQLRMLLQNLISNAIKFRRPAVAPVIKVKNLGTPPADDTVQNTLRFSVSDNGIGIAPKHHSRIFDLFQRLHTNSEVAGDGIGLAVCKRVAINHGGSISLDGTGEPGSTFTVSLGTSQKYGSHKTRVID